MGALFTVALIKPWLFGIGELIHTAANGNVSHKWYGNGGVGILLPFRKGWVGTSNTIYFSDTQVGAKDQPYYGTDVEINQKDILCHSFTLTATGHVPVVVMNFIKNHADTWHGKNPIVTDK